MCEEFIPCCTCLCPAIPGRRAPADTNFKRLENQLRANWHPVKLSKRRVATDDEHKLEVIQILKEESHVGQRELARRVRISSLHISTQT
ncbi:hypothetical protein Zmor_020555 [Zophobas morio]|uniref:Uncharacterized protein n=1 Tax=Zophobas morio TaxID=2755281 RepID=A0AA38I7Q4_9CUCU|nr:hypothetical protein Zmor_020555 [Zophobas morio]